MNIYDDIFGSFFNSAFFNHGKVPDWMQSLALNINDLEDINIEYHGPMSCAAYRSHRLEEDKKMEKRLREVLVPKMLKDIGRYPRLLALR